MKHISMFLFILYLLTINPNDNFYTRKNNIIDVNMNYEDFLVIDQRFYRPAEVEILVADPSKAREKLGWDPKVTFTEIALKMVRYDYDNLKKS